LSKRKIKERSNENLDPRVSRTKEFEDAICLGLLYIRSPKKVPIGKLHDENREEHFQPEKSRVIGGIIFVPLFKQPELLDGTGANKGEKWSSGK